jgi:hypothetical protein
MTKSWVHINALNLLVVSVIAKLRALIDNHVPLGYQDEAGFHFGVKPASDHKPLS